MENLKKFIYQFREIQPKFSRLYSRMLGAAGLTPPQYALLLALVYEAPKPMSMTAVSRKLYISKPAVTGLVDRLEKRKFIKRLAQPGDRRIALLEIQPAGKKLASRMQGHILNLMLRTVRQFTEKERLTIQRFYSVLSQNVDETLLRTKRTAP